MSQLCRTGVYKTYVWCVDFDKNKFSEVELSKPMGGKS